MEAFKASKINVEVIKWGADAMTKIKNIEAGKEEKPSLVFLDLILPDINGVEIFKEMKKNDATKNIPVFILSNYTNAELPKINGIAPEKLILKSSITPTQLVELVKKQLK
jgi:DNA-binding response OmpR family regulator